MSSRQVYRLKKELLERINIKLLAVFVSMCGIWDHCFSSFHLYIFSLILIVIIMLLKLKFMMETCTKCGGDFQILQYIILINSPDTGISPRSATYQLSNFVPVTSLCVFLSFTKWDNNDIMLIML